MEPRQYVAALRRRLIWLVAFGVLGVLGSMVVTQLTPPTYQSTIQLYFAGSGGAPAEVFQGTRYVQRLLDSYPQLATSALVLDPVIDELDMDTTARTLADNVTAQNLEDTVVLSVTATAASASRAQAIAEAIGDQLTATVVDVSPAGAEFGAVVVTTIAPASTPRSQVSPSARRNAAVGGAAGLAVGVLAVIARELSGPRIRNRAVLERLTTYPILGSIRGSQRRGHRPEQPDGAESGGADRGGDFQRLRLTLRVASNGQLPRRILVASSSPREDTRLVAAGLSRAFAAGGSRGVTDAARPGRARPDAARPAGAAEHSAPRHDLTAIASDHDFIDGGAVTTMSEAESRAGDADAAVVVVDVRYAQGNRIRRLLHVLKSMHLPVLGIVVNNDQSETAGGGSRMMRRILGTSPIRSTSSEPPGNLVPRSSQVTAIAGLALVGANYPLPFATTTALVTTIGLVPVWIAVLRQFRHARLLFNMAILALACGVLLAGAALTDHEIDLRVAVEQSSVFVSMFGAAGLVLWARTVISIRTIAIAYGIGMLADGALNSLASANPWKYQLSLPVTIIFLAVLVGRRERLGSAIALLVLGSFGIVFESRSYFGFCAVAAAGVLWQLRPATTNAVSRRGYSLLVLTATLTGVYFIGSTLLVSGALGEGLRERSTAQIQESGSLIAGGRPEWFATFELMQERPEGFGLGVVPTNGDVYLAKTGLADIGIPSSNGYVDNYLFGGQIKLHSVIADLWVTYGPVGLLIGVFLMLLIAIRLSDSLGRRQAPGLLLFLGLNTMWDLAFGPLDSAAIGLALATGLILSHRAARPEQALRQQPRGAPTSTRRVAVPSARW